MPHDETLQVVVVLYRCSPQKSSTIQTLRQCLLSSEFQVHVLIYDNSPESWQGELEAGWSYYHDPSNGALVAAYNMALNLARGYADWLLLLDQDSCLAEDFLQEVSRCMTECETDRKVAAIVPRIFSAGKLISPSRVRVGRLAPEFATGMATYEITALNSGSLLRVDILDRLNGFNRNFRLDFLDHWLYWQIYQIGCYTYISSATLQHNLSVSDYNRSVSYERYVSILSAERLFINTCKPVNERLLYSLRLAMRAIKQYAILKERRIARLTVQNCFSQILSIFNVKRDAT